MKRPRVRCCLFLVLLAALAGCSADSRHQTHTDPYHSGLRRDVLDIIEETGGVHGNEIVSVYGSPASGGMLIKRRLDIPNIVVASSWSVRTDLEDGGWKLADRTLLYRVYDDSLTQVYDDVLTSPLKDYPHQWNPQGGSFDATWHFVGSIKRALRIDAKAVSSRRSALVLRFADALSDDEDLPGHFDEQQVRQSLDVTLSGLRGFAHPHVVLDHQIQFVDRVATGIFSYESRKLSHASP